MTPNAALPPRGTALLLALVTALLLFRLGDVPLVGPDEPRYARVAVEMHRRGDWIVPTLQGQPWLEKPALYYWMAGGRVLRASGRRRRRPACLPCSRPSCSPALTALVGARLYGAGGGTARRVRRRHLPARVRLRPRRVHGHAAGRDRLRRDRPDRPAPRRHRGTDGRARGGRVRRAGHARQGTAGRAAAGARRRSPISSPRAIGEAWRRIASRVPLAILAMVVVAGPWYAPSSPPRAARSSTTFLLEPQRPALHVDHPPPSRAHLLLRARAAGRPLPVGRA